MSAHLKVWRESASLILAAKAIFSQPSPFNYKVLCLKRSSKSKFMPDTYVFPGGNISKSDNTLDWLKLYEKFGFSKQAFDDLRPAENVPAVLQNDDENSLPRYLSFRICAIRETFEECGILMCKSPKINSDTVSQWASFIGGHEFIAWQQRVNDDPNEFLNMCKHFEIFPDVWALKNWSHWMTPASNKTHRFSAVFFIATTHQMPNVHGDDKEIQDLMWTTPDECLQMNSKGTVMLPVPQFYEMSRLKTVLDVNALSSFASNRARFGFETFWPYRIDTNNGVYTVLPGDDLYPKNMDKDFTEIPRLNELPESENKHRVLHKSAYSNLLEIENFSSACRHIVPMKSI